ncbi:MAG: CRISPR-associated protein Cas6, partial [Calditrichaeota bacterium]
MLLSLVLQLTPLTTSRLRGPTGRDTQAWFLRRIQEHDPALAEELHAANG